MEKPLSEKRRFAPRVGEGRICGNTVVVFKEEDIKEAVAKLKANPYAYLCNKCCTVLECPCFVDEMCPECGSKLKTNLYADFDLVKNFGEALMPKEKG